ncbi:MAG TPA: nucleotide synthetase [Allosphingosinicella sp.]|nr:nucleotide synthetase [Allosphingosinicella sp.]
MSEEDKAYITSMPVYEVNDYDEEYTRRPTEATVREIDFEISEDGKELDFFFSRADFSVPISVDLNTLLRDIRDNAFGYGNNAQKEPRDPFESRLSLGNKKYVYVIYRLSDNKRWQFCRDFAPITLGKKAADSGRYFEARRFDKDGVARKIKDGTPAKDESIVAYFIADNENSGNYNGHSINLHVDLLYQGTRRRLPITIDPDIRYPGGSGEP